MGGLGELLLLVRVWIGPSKGLLFGKARNYWKEFGGIGRNFGGIGTKVQPFYWAIFKFYWVED